MSRNEVSSSGWPCCNSRLAVIWQCCFVSNTFLPSSEAVVNVANNLLTGTIPVEIIGKTKIGKHLEIVTVDPSDHGLTLLAFRLIATERLSLEFNTLSGSLPTEIGLAEQLSKWTMDIHSSFQLFYVSNLTLR